MSTRTASAGDIKEGSYIMIDNMPCRVVEVEKSKTGKHGSAKARIVGIGVIDGVKRTIVVPTDAAVEVPVIEKFTAQVISISGDSVQLMDLRNYQTFEIPSSYIEDEAKGKLEPGVQVEVWDVAGYKKIMRTR
ncbi:translation initiation factor IF-5A [Caldivirga maquilingensis]|uniref:Translation initiation factor 5A n=1 Tax=Caldivirga maquilingensis (strain ATCC 700844 / DSM 13496 / JCM 10307 / IC-167) TaxID=397948 RepID=IF5A_CALMQ|nr:translation initiation factor IF-5A [Caldivirga maquilingensis]A8MD73.1 RecName: Full=Translation initiation factor 5A; AltName: Full=Hypusine-containing protein; AltName: Full=eIF-5A [Caldivirga maquilingensis IC-167]ABW01729.1 translation initiation factor eIF-5A [Caldivirga maquilingensis IC-167]